MDNQRRRDEEDKEMFEKIVNDTQRHDKKIQEDLKQKLRMKLQLDKTIEQHTNELFHLD